MQKSNSRKSWLLGGMVRAPGRVFGNRPGVLPGSLGLAGDISGNVLPMAAAGLLVTAALVGGAVDMSRAYNVDNRLQAACDAGVLAGRRAVIDDGFNDDAEERANTYFHANFNEDEQDAHDTVFNATSPDNGNSVNGTASTKVQTRIMRIFGFDEMDMSASCSASMGVGNSDIMFVLDNTGSMAETPDGDATSDFEESKMFALQEAMKGFYDTVATSVAGSNARIRYGFVPYSTTVNVGALLMAEDSSYVADTMTISTRRPMNWSAVVATWTDPAVTAAKPSGDFEEYSSTRYTTVDSCNSAKPADATSFTTYDTETTTTSSFDPARGTEGQKVTATGTQQYQRKADYECIYKDGKSSVRGYYVNRRYLNQEITSYSYEARNPVPVELPAGKSFSDWVWGDWPVDVSAYKTGNASALVSSTGSGSSRRTALNGATPWGGCIQERQTVPVSSFSFASLETGITPDGALDLDIDSAPTDDDSTKWKPLWPTATFRRNMVQKSLTGSTSSMINNTPCPFAAQLLTEMSEEDFEEYAEDLIATGNTYHDIGLLWGARLSSPTGIFATNVMEEPDNGGTVSRHLIFMTDGALKPASTINSAYGIEVDNRRVTTDGRDSTQEIHHRSRYLAVCEAIKARGIRLWVIAFGSGVDLSADLITCASPSSSFKADDTTELNEHFQEIANQVGELRVVQ